MLVIAKLVCYMSVRMSYINESCLDYAKHPETGLEELFKIFSSLPYPNLCLLEILR